MNLDAESQIEKLVRTVVQSVRRARSRGDLFTPNPKLKLLTRYARSCGLKHYSIRTERRSLEVDDDDETSGSAVRTFVREISA
jgi:hypothetical protein